MRRLRFSAGTWRRVVKSQVDLGKRRCGLTGARRGTQVSGVRRKRKRSVREAIVIAAHDNLLRNLSILLSMSFSSPTPSCFPDLLISFSSLHSPNSLHSYSNYFIYSFYLPTFYFLLNYNHFNFFINKLF